MECNTEQDGDKTILTLRGDLTIQRAAEILAILKSVQGQAKSFGVVLAHDAVVDCSTLQLLCSAHRCAVAGDQRMTLAAEDGEALADYAMKTGYRRGLGCRFSGGAPCLWCQEVTHE